MGYNLGFFLGGPNAFPLPPHSAKKRFLHANRRNRPSRACSHISATPAESAASGPEPLGRYQSPSGIDLRRPQPPPTWWSQSSTARLSKATFAPQAISIHHIYLYREFPQIGGNSSTPTLSSQRPGPRLGRPSPASAPRTRLLPRPRPCHGPLTAEEVAEAYVRNTGAVIVRRFRANNLDPLAVPGVLVAGHAPFAWGKTVTEAVENADVLEYIARLAFRDRSSLRFGSEPSGRSEIRNSRVRFRIPLSAETWP